MTTWPFEHPPGGRPAPALSSFLESPRPLSEKATRGFLSRFRDSKLRKPERLVDALERHLAAMEVGSRDVAKAVEALAS